MRLQLKWNELVDNYFKKHEANIFKFNCESKTIKEEEIIYVYLKHNINEEIIKQLELEALQKTTENDDKINKLLEDENLYINDMRVMDDMVKLYKNALIETKSTLVKNPHYILEHMDIMKRDFYEYMIDIISNIDYCGIQKRLLLESNYAKYMSNMTGIPIILPDGLEYV